MIKDKLDIIADKLTDIVSLLDNRTESKKTSDRFNDNNDGTVTDTKSGLMWLKDSNNFQEAMCWYDAKNECGYLGFAGHVCWRLPTIEELCSLIDRTEHGPAIPAGSPFFNVQSNNYWSASSYLPNPNNAWRANMDRGHVYDTHKSNCYYVWPVRISPDN